MHVSKIILVSYNLKVTLENYVSNMKKVILKLKEVNEFFEFPNLVKVIIETYKCSILVKKQSSIETN